MSKVLIFGAGGQDGFFLSKFLLSLGHSILGVTRHNANFSIEKLSGNSNGRLQLVNINLHKYDEVKSLISFFEPEFIYNLVGKSDVANSFQNSKFIINNEFTVSLNILQSIKEKNPGIKYFQASSAEIFGNAVTPLDENSKINPVNPYGISKNISKILATHYRDTFNLFVSIGILFNHESFLRPLNFVTKKIIRTAALNILKIPTKITLGNIDVTRDWGYAPEFCEGFFLTLNHDYPSNYIFSTGHELSIKEFIKLAFSSFSNDFLEYVEIDDKLIRPTEIYSRIGSSIKINNELNWFAKTHTKTLVEILLEQEIRYISQVHTDLNLVF